MSLRVLLVDDSRIIRQVIQRVFGLTSISVGAFFEAENGAEALEILSNEWVDLIFLDVNMPIMNGMEFMKRVSVDPVFKSTPVVVVSTEGSDERKQELFEYGVKAFLRKPVTPEQLSGTIEDILGNLRNE